MKQFKIDAVVNVNYLGWGFVTKIIPNFYNKKIAQFYGVNLEVAPDVRYNMGVKEGLVFASDIIGYR